MKVTIISPEQFVPKAKRLAECLKPHKAAVKTAANSDTQSDVVLRFTDDGRVIPIKDRSRKLDLYIVVEPTVIVRQLRG